VSLIKEPKICLSESLEDEIFEGVLKKREIQALRERCEHYQKAINEEEKPEWNRNLFRPYSQYFGFLSSLKVKSALEELDHYGYLKPLEGTDIQIVDYGAGTLGASMGALDYFKEKNRKISNIVAVDQDEEPMKWAFKNFNILKKRKIEFTGRIPNDVSLDNTLVIAVDVFNELGLMDKKAEIDINAQWFKQLSSWIERATESTVFIFIEPATQSFNQNFLKLRNILKDKTNILLPCTHQMDCPALAANEWCHEDRNYKAPSKYWNFVHDMRFARRLLSYSILCLGKQKNIFKSDDARVVSRKLKGKGRCDKWLCGNGKRWKAGLLNRHKSEENQDFFDSIRGDIVDCSSTGVTQPD
jgi:hypothetical protein